MENAKLEKYARLVVKTGINLQKGQTLVVNTPIECASFARIIAAVAYREGARDVVLSWRDEKFSKIRFMEAPDEIFDEFPHWQQEMYVSLARKGAAFISISASDPELMKEVDPNRMTRAQRASNTSLQEYRERLMSNQNTWCVVSIPTSSWAMKVFPGVTEEEAVAKLWEAILKAVRLEEEDPVAGWQAHQDNLKRSTDFLNRHAFKELRYHNSLGTDLTIRLPEKHLWLGGSESTPEGVEFIANMPTEEVFTLPVKTGVNGKVVSSRPLNYNGNLIDRFSLTFREGKVVDFHAEQGYESLKGLLETDEGACYLGEVALVPFNSPISQSKILFYNTLFDENASCHLALGKAYPCIQGAENMTKEELKAAGVNDSLIHEDFMIGTPDLQITGITADGAEIPVFRDGNFAF
mgnify:CR=1 FL=1